MKVLPLLVRAAILLAPAVAATAADLPAAADARAAVPPTRYQGAVPYRAASVQPTSPDRNWQATNRTVAAYNSMMLTMDMPAPADAPATGPAADPAAAPPTAGQPMQHHHHHEASQ